ncbi:hypothetical protein HanRHA438_Chr15g0706761 [Helianthus annuus]|nr:hypothetical protein HanRHA438_Chr15g0706761 [Helianthus annuus]
MPETTEISPVTLYMCLQRFRVHNIKSIIRLFRMLRTHESPETESKIVFFYLKTTCYGQILLLCPCNFCNFPILKHRSVHTIIHLTVYPSLQLVGDGDVCNSLETTATSRHIPCTSRRITCKTRRSKDVEGG